jgi:4-amino-4-deoxy-L-arabinose transferase-like glycosyltransferase
MGSRRSQFVLLIAVLLLAAAVRFWGIRFGLPGLYRPDEEYFVNAVVFIDRGDYNPHFFYYPSFYMYFNVVVWRLYIFAEILRGNYTPPQPIAQFLAQHPNIIYLIGRCVSAVFGAATVLLVFLIGRRFYSATTGLMGAFFLAANPVHTLNSHFFKSDVATVFFIVLALLFMLHYIENGRRRHLIWASIFTGVAFSTNYYGGFLLIPLVTTKAFHALHQRKRLFPLLREYDTFVAPLIVIVVFLLLSPYVFLDYHTFLYHFHRMLFCDRVNLYQTMVQHDFSDYSFQKPLLYSLQFGLRHAMGIVPALLSIISIIYLVLRRRPFDLCLVLFVVVYFFFINSGKAVFVRYYLGIVPLLSLFLAEMIVAMWRRFFSKRGALGITLGCVVVLLVAAEPIYTSLMQSHLLAQPDTRTLAAEWIAKNIPPGSKIAAPLEYHYGKPTLEKGCSYVKLGNTVMGLQQRNVNYVLIDEHFLRLYSPPQSSQLAEELAQQAVLLKRFPMSDQGQPHPIYDQLDGFYVPVARFAELDRPGPEISIYQLQ